MNKIKKKIAFSILLLVSFSAAAYVTIAFPGWDTLTDRSSDILVVRCVNVQDPFNLTKNGHQIDFQGLIDSDFEIVSVLKGTRNSGIVRMSSEYWPKQGCFYLLFKNYNDGAYAGLEAYRVVPLGSPFSTNSISGKSLNEQLRILFRRAASNLNLEIQDDQADKDRLEQALQK